MTSADPIGKRSAHRAGPLNRLPPTIEGGADRLSIGAKFLVVLLFAYYALKPVYLFSSGDPQIADGVIILLTITIVFWGPILENSRHRSVATAALVFSLYTAIVNLSWALIANDPAIAKHALYHVFNFLILYCTLRACEVLGERTLKIFGLIVAVVLILYAGIAEFMKEFASALTGGGRETLFFNNPNQLGYWSLLSACILGVSDRFARLPKIVTVTAYACAGFLCMLSLSKGAMISFLVLMIIVCIRRWIYIVCAVTVSLPLVFLETQPEIIENASGRIENIGQQNDDSLEGRGYDRIWKYPEYLFFGAGEGAQNRLNLGGELHSTLGTVLFSYGVVGFGLFTLIIRIIYKNTGLSLAIFLIPPLLYGLTHQGLRFSIFWVLIAILSLQWKRDSPS